MDVAGPDWICVSHLYPVTGWELCERKSFPLITLLLLVIWRLLVQSQSFPRLFSANDPHLSFGRWGRTLHYCQSKMKPCNAQERKGSQLKQKKMIKNADPASPDFPRRYSQQMASRRSGRAADWDGRRSTVCSTSLIIHSPLFLLFLSISPFFVNFPVTFVFISGWIFPSLIWLMPKFIFYSILLQLGNLRQKACWARKRLPSQKW